MSRLLATGLIVALSFGAVLAQEPAKAGGAMTTAAVTKTLLDMEHQWVALAKASNGDGLAAILAEDFVALDSDGSMHGKSDVVARTKKGKWTTNEIGDLKVNVHGDSAVVTGSWSGNGTDGYGKAVNAKERWADTWVKMANGKWQCVASASAPLK
jgi:ketosteroid isomerase-like protein